MMTRVAYLIRNGESHTNVSNKLRAPNAKSKAIKAAKRMGFKSAYAAKVIVAADCVLIGDR